MSSDHVTGAEPERPFVVGIGASAGGLEALSALVQHVAVDSTAFVIVQHLAPHRESVLPSLLARVSRLPVVTIAEGMEVAANVVHVAPPDVDIALHNGIFRLTAADTSSRPRLPIDLFFRSLAEDCGGRAIGVVLSGTGSDGTFGLAAIKAAGGITFAQDPATAKFDGMPRSAIESGAADFRLSAEAIAGEIKQLCAHPLLRRRDSPLRIEQHLKELTALIKGAFGLDLSHYKLNTIERRLARRMAVHRMERFEDYLELCKHDDKELAILHKDLLINVTSFFRDKEPFEVLKARVFRPLLENRRDGAVVRVWVPGCSSGEEAYSIAICLLETADESGRNFKIQIFGTDVDADAVQQARRGIYPANIAADVSPERLRKFFVLTDDGQYQICRRIRDLVVFSLQNLSRDAPFSKLDLVSCRNLLIYLQPAIQQKVFHILHYALQPGGVLMLGTSESVGDAADLFSLVDRKNKLYVSKHVALSRSTLDLGMGVPPPSTAHDVAPLTVARPMVTLAHLADRKILEQYAPPGVVVNENLDILYFRGRTGLYLEQPSGVATHSLLRMVRPELHPPLRKAIDAVLATGEPAQVDTQLRDGESGFRALTLIVQPLQEPETRARCLLVLFKDASPADAAAAPLPLEPNDQTRFLAQELALTKDYLQSTIEELERANEDLKSANEELQSSNEELQSTNEELETSKEELQSTNEELITLNEELQNRMRDLSTANDDLQNILLVVDRALIIVGLDQRLRRFNPVAGRLLDLLPADLGRSAAQILSFFDVDGMDKLIAEAIDNVTTVERAAVGADQHAYVVRIVPYKTVDLTIRGAVISMLPNEKLP